MENGPVRNLGPIHYRIAVFVLFIEELVGGPRCFRPRCVKQVHHFTNTAQQEVDVERPEN